MIVVIDILHALGAYGSFDRELLANTLGCTPADLDSPLVLGVRRGLIGVGAEGWAEDPGSFAGSYTITEAGRELYGDVLDRFAQQVAGLPGLSIAERFLYACGDHQPSTVERKLVAIADDAGLQVMGDPVERDRPFCSRTRQFVVGRGPRSPRETRLTLGRWVSTVSTSAAWKLSITRLRSYARSTQSGLRGSRPRCLQPRRTPPRVLGGCVCSMRPAAERRLSSGTSIRPSPARWRSTRHRRSGRPPVPD